MKFLLIMAAIFAGLFIGLHTVLKDGSLMRYLDTHPHPTRVPLAYYTLGQGYFLFGDLQNSATYYQRLVERYPKSSHAQEAYFAYLRDLDDMNTPRMQMAELYQTYLDRYPKGPYAEIVRNRIDFCRNAR